MYIYFKVKSHCIALTDLKLANLLLSDPHIAGIIDVYHHALQEYKF
jgi:hypothetical protein